MAAERKSGGAPPSPLREPGRWLAWMLRARPFRTEGIGPLALLAERRHPLVRAELFRTRRKRRTLTAALVGVPVIVMATTVALSGAAAQGQVAPGDPGMIASAFAALWPLVLFAGAGMSAAGAVIAERTEDTAWQLALTPLPARVLAAAKVLPYARPFLWGALAALPLYALAGDRLVSEPGGVWGLLMAPWPTRMLLLAPGPEPEGLTPAGVGAGLLMGLLDAGMVWAAAHWGAGCAVRRGRLWFVPLRLAGHALVLALALPLFAGVAALWGGSCALATGMVLQLAKGASYPYEPVFSGDLVMGVALAGGLLFFLYVWRLYPLTMAAEKAIGEFADFDRLVADEFYALGDGPGLLPGRRPMPYARP